MTPVPVLFYVFDYKFVDTIGVFAFGYKLVAIVNKALDDKVAFGID